MTGSRYNYYIKISAMLALVLCVMHASKVQATVIDGSYSYRRNSDVLYLEGYHSPYSMDYEPGASTASRVEIKVLSAYPDKIQSISYSPRYTGYGPLERRFEGLNTRHFTFELHQAASGDPVIKTDKGTYYKRGGRNYIFIQETKREFDRHYSGDRWFMSLVKEQQLYVDKSILEPLYKPNKHDDKLRKQWNLRITHRPVTSAPGMITLMQNPRAIIIDNAGYNAMNDKQRAVIDYFSRAGRVYVMGSNGYAITGNEHVLGYNNSPKNMRKLSEELLKTLQDTFTTPPKENPGMIGYINQNIYPEDPNIDIELPVNPVRFLILGSIYLVFTLTFLIYHLRKRRKELKFVYILPLLSIGVSIILYGIDFSSTVFTGTTHRTTVDIYYPPEHKVSVDRFAFLADVPQHISIDAPHLEIMGHNYFDADYKTPNFLWTTTPTGDRIENYTVFRLNPRILRFARMSEEGAPFHLNVKRKSISIENLTGKEWNDVELWDLKKYLKISGINIPTGESVDVALKGDDTWKVIVEPLPATAMVLNEMTRYAVVVKAPVLDDVKVNGLVGDLKSNRYLIVMADKK